MPETIDQHSQAALQADSDERDKDMAHRFPGITQEAHDARASFSRKQMVLDAATGNERPNQTMARLRREADAAKELAASGLNVPATTGPAYPGQYGRIPGARKEYTCGCVATHPDPNAQLPPDCPTHTVPAGAADGPVSAPTLEEIMLAGYEREMADAIFAEEQRAYRAREKPYGPNKRRMPAQWPPETKET